MCGATKLGSHEDFLTKSYVEMPLQKRKGASSEVDADDREEFKRQYRVLIGKTGDRAPELTGREVPGGLTMAIVLGKSKGGLRCKGPDGE